MDELVHPYWNGATVPKHNLLGESEKYDGWIFVGSKGELRAACADSSIKYICIIPEYYSGKEIPKTSGSKRKVVLTEFAKEVLEKAKSKNSEGQYVFEKNGT